MAKSSGRRNQNRSPKPPRVLVRSRMPLPELHPDVIEPKRGQGGTLKLTVTAWEDTMLPVKLNFPPPLSELAPNPSAFDYNWQQLTYVFDLPNPLDAPELPHPITDPTDVRKLTRFIEVCEKVAKHRVMSQKGGITWKSDGQSWDVEVDPTDDDALVGFSTRFRQLHSDDMNGDPTFGVVSGMLIKAAKKATDPNAEARLELLTTWRKARAQLLKHPLKNLAATKAIAEEGISNPDGDLGNYSNVNPEKLISLFNYGEKIHYSKRHAEEFDELASDDFKHAHGEHEFVVSMLGLVHLYFGFSLLIRKIAGLAYVENADTRR